MSTSTSAGPHAELERALERLAEDGLVAFPTETVWGLAARAQSERAVAGLVRWKGRAPDQPISIMVAGSEALESCGLEVSPTASRLIEAFWPGPLTIVLPSSGERTFARGVHGEAGAVGVRCSPHPGCMQLVRAAADRGLGPLTATSLNRSGEPPATDLAQAHAMVGRESGAHAEPSPLLFCPEGLDAFGAAPSTVVDLSGGEPQVLRRGAIDVEALATVLGEMSLNRAARTDPC